MDAESLAQIREIVSESIAEVKRHNGVLIEDLRHKLDLVLEGQQEGISRHVEKVRAELGRESDETQPCYVSRTSIATASREP